MAGPTADGWRIVSLWDSEADFERFRDERLVPALKDLGRSLPPIEIWPIETVLTPPNLLTSSAPITRVLGLPDSLTLKDGEGWVGTSKLTADSGLLTLR